MLNMDTKDVVISLLVGSNTVLLGLSVFFLQGIFRDFKDLVAHVHTIDNGHTAHSERLDEHKRRLDDHDERIKELER